MKVSDAGVALVKEFEGFRSRPYQDFVGVWTIGYGETKGIGPGTPPMSQGRATELLRRRLDEDFAPHIANLGVMLNQHQFDALVSFVYNVGPGGVAASTGIGKALRKRDWKRAADELLKWSKAGGRTLPGLLRRRQAERAMFLQPAARSLDGYTVAEKRWIREYDELVREHKDEKRRRVLRRVMTEQRKRIWQAAQKTGWEKGNRRARYRSLHARTT